MKVFGQGDDSLNRALSNSSDFRQINLVYSEMLKDLMVFITIVEIQGGTTREDFIDSHSKLKFILDIVGNHCIGLSEIGEEDMAIQLMSRVQEMVDRFVANKFPTSDIAIIDMGDMGKALVSYN